jgi:hypothetical protein
MDPMKVPGPNTTIRELREWLKYWIEDARERRGEAFDIEAALKVAQTHTLMHVWQGLQREYKGELQAKYGSDPSRCLYCGNSLILYPGTGRYCDICADKFSDGDPYENNGDYEEGE